MNSTFKDEHVSNASPRLHMQVRSSGVPPTVTDHELARIIVGTDDIAVRLPAAMRRSKIQGARDLAERVSGLSQAILLRMHLNHPLEAVRSDAALLASAFNGVLLLSKGARIDPSTLALVRLGHAMAKRLAQDLMRLEVESPLVSFFPPRPSSTLDASPRQETALV